MIALLRSHRRVLLVLLHALVIVLGCVVFDRLSLRFTSLTMTGPEGHTAAVTLPFRIHGKANTLYQFHGELQAPVDGRHRVRIVPNDCIRSLVIRGQEIHDPAITPHKECTARKDLQIDLGPYLAPGPNPIEMTVESSFKGLSGLRIFPENRHLLGSTFGIILQLLVLSLVWHIGRLLRLDALTLGVVLGGVILRLLYLGYTDAFTRTHDMLDRGGHLDYLLYVFNRHALPDPYKGWEYHQPPFYYVLSTLLSKFLLVAGSIHRLIAYQLVSLAAGIGTVLVFAKTAALLFRSPLSRLCVVALTALWPSGIIHSVRVSNETPFYLLYALAFYFLLKWYSNRRTIDFWWMCLWCAAALFTKASALVIMAVAMVAWTVLFAASQNRRKLLQLGVGMVLIFLFSFAVVRGPRVASYFKGERSDWLAGDTLKSLNAKLKVNSELHRYFVFSYENYLSPPFANPWLDSHGRQYFWTYFLKTVLYGEFGYSRDLRTQCAVVMNFCLLVMIGYGFLGILLSSAKTLKHRAPVLLNCILPVAAVIFYRTRQPTAPTSDFRYIYPMLIAFCACVVLGIERFRCWRLPALTALGYATVAVFSLASVLFIIEPYVR